MAESKTYDVAYAIRLFKHMRKEGTLTKEQYDEAFMTLAKLLVEIFDRKQDTYL
jgi:hypothetical protein